MLRWVPIAPTMVTLCRASLLDSKQVIIKATMSSDHLCHVEYYPIILPVQPFMQADLNNFDWKNNLWPVVCSTIGRQSRWAWHLRWRVNWMATPDPGASACIGTNRHKSSRGTSIEALRYDRCCRIGNRAVDSDGHQELRAAQIWSLLLI